MFVVVVVVVVVVVILFRQRRRRRCQYNVICFSPHDVTAPRGPGSPHYPGFIITLRNITLGRTPLDE